MPAYSNSFRAPAYVEQEIINGKTGGVLGTVRIKPSGVAWKSKGARKWQSVSLKQFTDWITSDESGSKLKKS